MRGRRAGRGPRSAAGAPRRPAEAGFTLFEVVVALAVIGLITAALARVTVDGLRLSDRTGRRSEAQQHVRVALQRVAADTRSAKRVLAPAAGATAAALELTALGGWTVRYAVEDADGDGAPDLARRCLGAGCPAAEVGPHPVASGVAQFSVERPASGPARVRLLLVVEAPEGERFGGRLTILVRNPP